ncbi:hypothetical protein LCGC14_1070480 [marine sediment metagenome]|uniref:Uncharacterized protein n=1 Tax=marine sediment metagenome TaxID=412755 RepID=A0A0F9Q1F0_9ZZZZ
MGWRAMDLEAKVVFKLYWVCPECGNPNGLRGLAEHEHRFINGPLDSEYECKRCEAEVKLKAARR